MVLSKPRNRWVIWLSLVLALLLSVAPMPDFLASGRPLWLALCLTYWILALPSRIGMVAAWFFGLFADVLYGTLLGQNALVLMLTSFLVLTLQQRLRIFPRWQQCLVLLALFGLAQLLKLWLFVLSGQRPPDTLQFLYPVLISALLWPWVYTLLNGLKRRLLVN